MQHKNNIKGNTNFKATVLEEAELEIYRFSDYKSEESLLR